jgi:hypothetical protein
VLQSHLFARKLVRNCRVIFTIGFLAIFIFSYIINTVSSQWETTLNKGNELQYLFEASRFGEIIQFDMFESTFVVGMILFNHTMAIVSLFLDPEISPIAVMIDSFYARCLRLKGFSREDASMMVIEAESKYNAWLQPPLATTKQTKISAWFFFREILQFVFIGFPRYDTGHVVWYRENRSRCVVRGIEASEWFSDSGIRANCSHSTASTNSYGCN